MDGWGLSHVLLWVVQIAVVVALVALTRQVGLLHLRLAPLGPGAVVDGPATGARLELSPVITLRSQEHVVVEPSRVSLVVFASPTCSLCDAIMPGVKRLTKVESSVLFTVAVDDAGGAGLDYLATYGFNDAVATRSLETIAAPQRPFAVALVGADDGTAVVIGSGVVNTLEQIEELIARARDGVARGLDAEGEPVLSIERA